MKLADLDQRTTNQSIKDSQTLADAGIITLDIETIPAHGEIDFYSQGKRWIGYKNIVTPGRLASFAFQHWTEPNTVHYRDLWDEDMYEVLWKVMDSASYLVTWNGDLFDIKKIRGYLMRTGYPPFTPPKSIDLIKPARTFGFESPSLSYVARILNLPHQKLDGETGGASNWRGLVASDPAARKRMRRYCTHDVRVTTDAFMAFLPWAKLPVIGTPREGATVCPRCGSTNASKAGTHLATQIRYKQYRCNSCTGIFRTTFHSRASHAHTL